jgi:hypothetical protein
MPLNESLPDHSIDERGKFELASATASVLSMDFDGCTTRVLQSLCDFSFSYRGPF